MIERNSMDDIYRHICSQLNIAPEVRGTKELNNYSFVLTNLDNNVINVRNISKSHIFAESCSGTLWGARMLHS
jgi:hypothetical protein